MSSRSQQVQGTNRCVYVENENLKLSDKRDGERGKYRDVKTERQKDRGKEKETKRQRQT